MDRVTFGKKTKEYIEKGLFVRGNEFVRTPNIIGLKRDDDLFYIYKTNELGEVIVEAITEDKNFAYILVCDELGIELSLKDQLRLSRELFNIIATRTSSVKIVDENIDDNKVDDKVYRFVYNDMQYKDQKWKLKSTKYYDEIEAPSNLTQDEFYEFISILFFVNIMNR